MNTQATTLPEQFSQNHSIFNNQSMVSENRDPIKKVVLPGRRKSIYHDTACDIASITNDNYRYTHPTL